jgi:hypothetical protein
MALRFGVNFPAWFNPNYLPTKPSEPKRPEQSYRQEYYEFIEEFYFDGLNPLFTINNLSKYDDNYFLKNEKNGFISIYQIKYRDVTLDEKAFKEKTKEYDKKMRDYEKELKEHNLRMKKYDSLLMMHESAKYTYTQAEAEDLLEDLQIEEFNNQMAKKELIDKIKDCKENLVKINEEKHNIIL